MAQGSPNESRDSNNGWHSRCIGAFVAYIISDLYNGIYTRSGLFVMLAILGAGLVGFLDDWIKFVMPGI
ncbi:MAG: hypothetical protein CM15mP49_01220 [Actinomycetota bacterium]|nr:MAG: hypothetical protein CM15mP49_01220 [Actinomycetota bacterium]